MWQHLRFESTTFIVHGCDRSPPSGCGNRTSLKSRTYRTRILLHTARPRRKSDIVARIPRWSRFSARIRRRRRGNCMTNSALDVTLDELEQAAQFVHRTVPPTPQYAWPKLKARTGCTVWVKHENHTPTGAFKVRGGLVYMHRLLRSMPGVAGIVSATRGNHGQSISFAAARARIPATIYVPLGNSSDQNS